MPEYRHQSAENRGKECHRFWFRLRHTVILISNDRISASKKINRMALIRTLTVSTIAFEEKKEELYGFRQTDFREFKIPHNVDGNANVTIHSSVFLLKN